MPFCSRILSSWPREPPRYCRVRFSNDILNRDGLSYQCKDAKAMSMPVNGNFTTIKKSVRRTEKNKNEICTKRVGKFQRQWNVEILPIATSATSFHSCSNNNMPSSSVTFMDSRVPIEGSKGNGHFAYGFNTGMDLIVRIAAIYAMVAFAPNWVDVQVVRDFPSFDHNHDGEASIGEIVKGVYTGVLILILAAMAYGLIRSVLPRGGRARCSFDSP